MQLCRAGRGRVSRAADNSSEGRLAALPALLPSAGNVAEEAPGDPRVSSGPVRCCSLCAFLSIR